MVAYAGSGLQIQTSALPYTNQLDQNELLTLHWCPQKRDDPTLPPTPVRLQLSR